MAYSQKTWVDGRPNANARWNAAAANDWEQRIADGFAQAAGGQIIENSGTVTNHTTLSMTGKDSVLWLVTLGNSGPVKLEITGWAAGNSVTLVCRQDGTGNRQIQSWPTAKYDGTDGPPGQSLTAGAVDIRTFFHDGTDAFGFEAGSNMA